MDAHRTKLTLLSDFNFDDDGDDDLMNEWAAFEADQSNVLNGMQSCAEVFFDERLVQKRTTFCHSLRSGRKILVRKKSD